MEMSEVDFFGNVRYDGKQRFIVPNGIVDGESDVRRKPSTNAM